MLQLIADKGADAFYKGEIAEKIAASSKAHGGILTAALGGLLGRRHPLLAAAAERPFTKLPALDNCSVSVLEWPGPELHAFNDTAHLAVRGNSQP